MTTWRAALSVVAILLEAGACGRNVSQQTPSGKGVAGPHASATSAYKDPATGRFVPPPAAALPPSLNQASAGTAATTTPGLSEVVGVAGGAVVRLQGQFRNYMTASVGADGRPSASCSQLESRTER